MSGRVFVAGATGVTGRALLRLAQGSSDVIAHARPKSVDKLAGLARPDAAGDSPKLAAFELTDQAALDAALVGVTSLVSLIGTMKKRFDAGDTYESSDIGTTELLAAAAKRAGVSHFVLLSSVGAGKPTGAYLKAKARAEELVRSSGLSWTIFRPSFLIGEDRHGIPGFGAVSRLLGLKRYQPIRVDELARTILWVARRAAPVGVALEGRSLWQAVAEAR